MRCVRGREEKAAGRGDPVTTRETTANPDRVLINIHVHNEATFVYRCHAAQPYISTVSHSGDFSIYRLSPGLLVNEKMFSLHDKQCDKIGTETGYAHLGNV